MSGPPIIEAAQALISIAVREGATELCLEPTEQVVVIRHRINGQWCEVPMEPLWGKLYKTVHPEMVAYFRGLRLQIWRGWLLPWKRVYGTSPEGKRYWLRVSLLPAPFGLTILVKIASRKTRSRWWKRLAAGAGPT